MSVFVAAVALGIALRFWVSSFGHNYDLESYAIVASIVEDGGNVYAETSRYNYGPVWFNVIGGVARVARSTDDPIGSLELLLTSLLTLVDLGLCLLLRRRGGDGVALLFFLNPVSIIISGYHRQFGNLALLLGLAAADLFDRSTGDRLDSRAWLGMLLLGISLATKHVLFAFSFWLALKQRRPFDRFVVFVVPVLVFITSFVPYWGGGGRGILDNVFLYSSFGNAPFWNALMPPLVAVAIPPTVGMLLALTIAGFAFRRAPAFESALLYTAVLLIFSPSVANQYLALVMPYAAWFFNPFSLIFTAGATTLLAASPDGLGLTRAVGLQWLNTWGFAILVTALALSFLWVFYRREMTAAVLEAGHRLLCGVREPPGS